MEVLYILFCIVTFKMISDQMMLFLAEKIGKYHVRGKYLTINSFHCSDTHSSTFQKPNTPVVGIFLNEFFHVRKNK